ncbi:MAG: transposase [Egibacteraceae bacterium]
MAKRYLTFDRDQQFLLPPDPREWLPADHLAWSVLDAVAQMDTSAFHTATSGGPGRPPWDPDLLLALLAYSYRSGNTDSRDIEDACRTDIAYRVIRGGRAPDHSVISRGNDGLIWPQ